MIDLQQIVPALRDQGAAIVIDATQAAGILPIDVRRLGADYLVFPTYKWLLGPYTLAFLYVAPSRQDGTSLEHYGANHVGGAEPFTGKLGAAIPSARRFDMGQRNNPVNLPMALAGMELLHGWGHDAVAARLRSLTDSLADHAEECGLRAVPRPLRSPHILGLQPPTGRNVTDIVASLAAMGVYVAERGGNIRIGAHVFNDESDIALFGDTLRGIMAQAG